MDAKLKSEIILRCWHTINDLPLSKCTTAHLPPDFLRDNNIAVSDLDWYPENKIDLEPRFCDPYPTEKFDALYRRTQATNYPGHGLQWVMKWDLQAYEDEKHELKRRIGMSHAASNFVSIRMGAADDPTHIAAQGDWLLCMGERLFKPRASSSWRASPSMWHYDYVLKSLPWPQPELPTDPQHIKKLERRLGRICLGDWPMAVRDAIRRPGKKSSVHMGVVLYDASEICEDKILLSELSAASCIIREGMRINRYVEEHAIFPVFVYSWSGFHVRVLQVHFDLSTSRLIVRKTPYIEISGPEKQDEMKLLMRWMMNVPKGDTGWEDLDLRSRAASANSSPLVDEPPSPTKRSIRCP